MLSRKIYLASCLYDCIEDNNIRAIDSLLSINEADPNIIIPDKGITPFHFAVGSGSENTAEKIVRLFLRHGANPNVRSEENMTPVHVAAAWGRADILNLLIKSGGDPVLKDGDSLTPLDYAMNEHYSDIVSYLQEVETNLLPEVELEELNYNLTLDKVIITNSDLEANYDVLESNNETFSKKSTNCVENDKNSSSSHNNTSNNEELQEKSSFVKLMNVTRESGILTIPSSSTNSSTLSSSLSSINSCENCTMNQCFIDVNELDENIRAETTTSQYETCSILNSSSGTNNYENLMTSDKNTNSLLTSDLSNDIVNIEEEYKYVDEEQGIVLIEKRLLVNPSSDENKSVSSSSSSLPLVLDYDTDTLRKELTLRGEPPGPITKTTKRVYLKKLKRLQKVPEDNYLIVNSNSNRIYSVELERTLRNPSWTNDLTSCKRLEQIIIDQFNKPDSTKRWREGLTKASFTYLLLDPRITGNLPLRSEWIDPHDSWRTFLSAIFYVGKGKRSRPYAHLYEAITHWDKSIIKTSSEVNKKVDYILNIWRDRFGVICLHIFQNVIPVEAYTREAAMINALKLSNLCNSKSGDFYGLSATWPEKQKRLLGVYLLYRAFLIFLNEGERQLRPNDIGR